MKKKKDDFNFIRYLYNDFCEHIFEFDWGGCVEILGLACFIVFSFASLIGLPFGLLNAVIEGDLSSLWVSAASMVWLSLVYIGTVFVDYMELKRIKQAQIDKHNEEYDSTEGYLSTDESV